MEHMLHLLISIGQSKPRGHALHQQVEEVYTPDILNRGKGGEEKEI